MKHTLTLLATLLLAPLATLHAADADQAGRLPSSDCNLRLEAPVEKWNEAIPLGNGQLGALVWGRDNQLVVMDRHSLIAEPLFVNAVKDDYRLRASSPAFKLGFQRIPIEKIGCYRDALRHNWTTR